MWRFLLDYNTPQFVVLDQPNRVCVCLWILFFLFNVLNKQIRDVDEKSVKKKRNIRWKTWISYSKVNNTYLLKMKNRTVWYVKKIILEYHIQNWICVLLWYFIFKHWICFFSIINLQIILYIKYVSLSQYIKFFTYYRIYRIYYIWIFKFGIFVHIGLFGIIHEIIVIWYSILNMFIALKFHTYRNTEFFFSYV